MHIGVVPFISMNQQLLIFFDVSQDAPINKLLFAKDRPRYRKMLQDMYTEIRCTPQHSQKQIEAYHRELSEVSMVLCELKT